MATPSFPPGRSVDLVDRGTTFIREVGDGQHTLVLIHGWTASSDLHWHRCYDALGTDHRVVAMDQRGHGRGIRTRQKFSLEACADDVAVMATELGLDRIVPVGFSMGGLIAQLLWQRHRSLVDGLVLIATSDDLRGNALTRAVNNGVATWATAGRIVPKELRQIPFDVLRAGQLTLQGVEPWQAEQRRMLDVTVLGEGAAAIGAFSTRRTSTDIDVPTAVIAFSDDDTISPSAQRRLAEAIPTAVLFEHDGPHQSLTRDDSAAVDTLVRACASVTGRL